LTASNVIRFPLWLVERRGECVQGPAAPVIVLPVIRIERSMLISSTSSEAEKINTTRQKRRLRKRRAKR
jgi:hypothetical protein